MAIFDLLAAGVAVGVAVSVFGPKSKYPWIAGLSISLLSTLTKTVKLMSLTEHPAEAGKPDPARDSLHKIGMEYSLTTVAMILQSTHNAERWLLRLGCGHEVWIGARRKPKAKTCLCRECPTVKNLDTY